MISPPFLGSLRTRILLAVVVCAVLPLAAVGLWLTSAAARSSEVLLSQQLDARLERAVSIARERWRYRRSEATMLAANAPIRAALRDSSAATAMPEYVRRAFADMPYLAGALIRDAAGRTRWTLGEDPSSSQRTAVDPGATVPIRAAMTSVRVGVVDDSSGATLGDVLAFTRMSALIQPASADMDSDPDAVVYDDEWSVGASQSTRTSNDIGGEFLAVHDRASGAWLRPSALPESLLDATHFDWKGHRWLAKRRSLDEPPIDIIAVAELDPFVEPFARNAEVGASALAVVGIVVLALTVLVTGRLTRSLAALARAADAVAAGDLDARVDTIPTDDVGRVARTFNAMVSSVQRMMVELSQREAVAAMGELAATLAHQVRSPATAMRLDVQRAHDMVGIGSPERALLARTLEQLDRLERAVAGSLKVARSVGSEFQELDPREALRRAIDGVRRACIGQAPIDDSTVSAPPISILGDAASLEQLFANVLTNAVQASARSGRVSVSADTSDGSRITVRIRDEGHGMAPAVLARAGEPLFSTKPEGTGLGLSIAKRIASAHRGELTIMSAPGGGTTVEIDLPCVVHATVGASS